MYNLFMAKRHNKDIEKTQEFIARSEGKTKSMKPFLISLGTLAVTTAAAVGIVLVIDAAKNDEI